MIEGNGLPEHSTPTRDKRARSVLFKIGLISWIVAAGVVFLLVSAACVYFAWEEGWIQFIPTAVALALVALAAAAVFEFLHKR